MKSTWLTIVVLYAACDSLAPPAPASMPWLHGFRAAAVSDVPTLTAAQRISSLVNAFEDDYGGLEARADLAGDSEPETVLASYHCGVVVVDAAGRLIARAPGFDAGGSADDLLSIAVGDGQLGTPVILVAVQTGGHRENTISLAMYRTSGRALQQLFSAPIEVHQGNETLAGSLTFLPSGLLYRAPDARFATRWTFDTQLGRYVEHTPLRTEGTARPAG